VRSTWRVNGAEVGGRAADQPVLEFVATGPRYDIELVQDDGLGLPNSRVSVRMSLNVEGVPSVVPRLPLAAIEGFAIGGRDIGLPDGFVLVRVPGFDAASASGWGPGTRLSVHEGAVAVAEHRAGGPSRGVDVVLVGWQPRGEGTDVLAVFAWELQTFAPLTSRVFDLNYSVPFNPVNSFARVSAPEINRGPRHTLSYEWRDAASGRVVSRGADASLPVQRGVNAFELIISEDGSTAGSTPLRIPVSIITD
jgi:hypothetical protein